MARKSSRWNVKSGGVAVLVDEMLLRMGWVENGCVDGCMGSSSSRMLLGDATSWHGLVVAQKTFIGIRRNRISRWGAGCMSWRLLSSEPRRLSNPTYSSDSIESVGCGRMWGCGALEGNGVKQLRLYPETR